MSNGETKESRKLELQHSKFYLNDVNVVTFTGNDVEILDSRI